METTAIARTVRQAESPSELRQVRQKEDDAPSGKRQRSGRSDTLIQLPEDQVTLSNEALQEQPKKPSQPVSPLEKATLLGSQKLARFSVYG